MGYYEEHEKISKVEEQFNKNPSEQKGCQSYTVEDALAKWGVDVKKDIWKE